MLNKGPEGLPYKSVTEQGEPVVDSDAINQEKMRLLSLNGDAGKGGGEVAETAHGKSSEKGRGVAESREPGTKEGGDEQLRQYGEWVEAWESYAELHESIAEDIAELESANLGDEYGEYSRALEDLKTAQERVENLATLCAGEEVSVQDLMENEELASAFEAFYKDYREQWSAGCLREKVRAEEEARGLNRALQIDGISGVRAGGEALALLNKRYATEEMRAWPLQGIAGMRFVPKPFEDIEQSGDREKFTKEDIPGVEITIEGDTDMSAEAIAREVSRKIAECNNWENATTLTVIQRTQFLQEVTELKKSPTHTLEELDPKPDGLQEGTAQYRAFEVDQYWKTLNERYDSDPDTLKREHLDEYNLVEKWRNQVLLTKEGVEGGEAQEQDERGATTA